MHACNVDLVVALGGNLAEVIFVEEIVVHHQTPFIWAELDVVRAGTGSQLQHMQEFGSSKTVMGTWAGAFGGDIEMVGIQRNMQPIWPRR